MITELIFMNGYGPFVWSAFIFTFLCFASLYIIVRAQYKREKKKFIAKFGTLQPEKAKFAKSQSINREILSNTSGI